MIVFNNQRILHGRQKFELNGGKRLLKVYYNYDEIKQSVFYCKVIILI